MRHLFIIALTIATAFAATAAEGEAKPDVRLFNLAKIGKSISSAIPDVEEGEGQGPSSILLMVNNGGLVAGSYLTYNKKFVTYAEIEGRLTRLCHGWEKSIKTDTGSRIVTFLDKEEHFSIVMTEDDVRGEIAVSYGPG